MGKCVTSFWVLSQGFREPPETFVKIVDVPAGIRTGLQAISYTAYRTIVQTILFHLAAKLRLRGREEKWLWVHCGREGEGRFGLTNSY
jgi:hypothetical protein